MYDIHRESLLYCIVQITNVKMLFTVCNHVLIMHAFVLHHSSPITDDDATPITGSLLTSSKTLSSISFADSYVTVQKIYVPRLRATI